jgi:hypothetical protein
MGEPTAIDRDIEAGYRFRYVLDIKRKWTGWKFPSSFIFIPVESKKLLPKPASWVSAIIRWDVYLLPEVKNCADLWKRKKSPFTTQRYRGSGNHLSAYDELPGPVFSPVFKRERVFDN